MDFGLLGTALVMGIAATGSAIGIGIAGQAAIGAWKKRYAQNKQAPFLLMVLAGAPLSQTIYAMVLMVLIKGKVAEAGAPCMMYALMGLFAGIGFLASALLQGKAGACAADAFGETDKGFANYLMILGIVETVALFTLVFGIMML